MHVFICCHWCEVSVPAFPSSSSNHYWHYCNHPSKSKPSWLQSQVGSPLEAFSAFIQYSHVSQILFLGTCYFYSCLSSLVLFTHSGWICRESLHMTPYHYGYKHLGFREPPASCYLYISSSVIYVIISSLLSALSWPQIFSSHQF